MEIEDVAIRKDEEIRQYIKEIGKEMGVNEKFLDYFAENGVELVIEPQEYGLVYNRSCPTSLKAGNIFVDIRKTLEAAAQIVSGAQRPAGFFEVVQMVLLVVLNLKEVVNVKLPERTAEILIVLMDNDGDGIAVEEDILYEKVQEYCKRNEIEKMEQSEYTRINNFLNKYGIIEICEGKILLKERVFGKDFV